MGSLEATVRVYASREILTSALAKDIVAIAKAEVNESGRFSMALSGGSSPKPVYELLATDYKNEMPWKESFFFFGDERCVPHSSDESNFRMVNEAMFARVPVQDDNIFALENQDKDPEEAARQYEERVKKFFGLADGEFPRFSVNLLGMGDDGHTASLFPGTEALKERKRICVANYVEKFQTNRITLTYPSLNHARHIMLLVAGKAKAKVAGEIFGMQAKDLYPVQQIKPDSGALDWYVDKETYPAELENNDWPQKFSYSV